MEAARTKRSSLLLLITNGQVPGRPKRYYRPVTLERSVGMMFGEGAGMSQRGLCILGGIHMRNVSEKKWA
jgi:hypothetical protein